MDGLERAGRAVRDAVGGETEPNDRVRARARTIVRHRRMLAVGTIATAVIAASVGIGFAARGSGGLGVHTIAPAGSSTTRSAVTRPVARTTSTTGPAPHLTLQTGHVLPQIGFVDSLHGWRAAPSIGGKSIDFSDDGGRTWTVQERVEAGNHATNTVLGVVAIDRQHAFALAYAGNAADGAALPNFLLRTTDGTHWARVATGGLEEPLFTIDFADPTHGWGITERDRLVSTADGGDTWRAMARPTSGGIGDICLGAPGSGWVATGTAVYGSVDDGATWARQATIPFGGGTAVLVCNGDHVAFASYGQGAGQHIGGFLRTHDGGARWRALVEDANTAPSPITVPGFPDSQLRGNPTTMADDGTLVFQGGCYVCVPAQNWVVAASPADRFVVGRFDDTGAQRFEIIDATAVDSSYVFAEVRRLDPNSATGGTALFYAGSDGGHTWELRWSGSG